MPQPSDSASNIKETIESILVAFILAFIFRAFVVEAFVIPTGSMAPTLLGAHMRFQCPDCGYVFDVNVSLPDSNSDDMVVPTSDYPPDDIYCPNCGFHLQNGPEMDRNGRQVYQRDHNGRVLTDEYGIPQRVYPYGTPKLPVRYGDRILVLKYSYLFNPPNRWDVVVFKAPYMPDTFHYTQNFIKRLVGKPGETLMVLDGDIYIQDSSGNWQIQSRPPAVQEAVWRVVYNNDFYPQGLPRNDRVAPWTQPWQAVSGDGWNLGASGADGRTFHFSSTGEGTIGYTADANPGQQTTNDYLVYDVPQNERRPGTQDFFNGDRDRNIVSDLKLALWYQRASGEGPLKLRLTKRDHAFVAEISGDSATLWHTHPDGTTSADAGPVKLSDLGISPGAPLWVEFADVDYNVTLRLNGKDALHTTPADFAPDVNELLQEFESRILPPIAQTPPTIQIIADNQTCSISHLGLWRDIYYINRSGEITWATPTHPIHLHRQGEKREDSDGVYDDDEYFVMGDNSLISGDARIWTQPIDLPYENLQMDSGRVPGRFLLGKAFFVYWPAGFRPVDWLPSLVPDFGDMRFIH